MDKFLNATRRFLRDEEGVTAIEYGLIAALIAIVIVAAITLIGDGLQETFENIAACLGQVSGGTCPT